VGAGVALYPTTHTPTTLNGHHRPEGPAAKKVPQTDAIFAHVQETRAEAAADPDTLRTSLDTKAKVKVGDFSGAAGAGRRGR
jgi:hypothetical protein